LPSGIYGRTNQSTLPHSSIRARPAYEEIGDPRLMVSFERNMAESMRATGHLQRALVLNRSALDFALLLDDYEGRRKATNNLALCQIEAARYSKGIAR